MAEENTPKMTPFDCKVAGHRLQMVKAAIPYLPPSEQKMIGVFVKFQELQNTIEYFRRGGGGLSAQALGGNGSFPLMDMLNDMRDYCGGEERGMLDSAISMMNMMQMYETYQETMKQMNADGGDAGDGGTMEMLKALLPPEQQEMFDAYAAMFPSAGKEPQT